MATKKITWGTIGLSFGIALMIGIFGLTAISVTNMSPLVYNTCILLAILSIISFVLGYRLLVTGLANLEQENIKKEKKLKETLKTAFREVLKEDGEAKNTFSQKPQKPRGVKQ